MGVEPLTQSEHSGGGALQLLEHPVLLDAARDDDGGGDAESFLREVNPLGRPCALEPVDLKRVPVNTARAREECQAGADNKAGRCGGGKQAEISGEGRCLRDT